MKALVKAWIRNLKGRKSHDSSRRCIFFAMSTWWMTSPCGSLASAEERIRERVSSKQHLGLRRKGKED
jgi:hypothetical protein